MQRHGSQTLNMTRLSDKRKLRHFAAVAAVLAVLLGLGVAQAGAFNYSGGGGTVTSDAGFRPSANGFSFENYTNEGNPQNLDASAMRKLFGAGVCVEGQAQGACSLTPAARQWALAVNAAMAGGHCYGMAAIASFFYGGQADPGFFGSSSVPQLPASRPLQNLIAYGWAMQKLPSVYSGSRFQLTPNQVVNVLSQLLPSREPLVLTIFMRNGTGGHAITPFALENRGGGNVAIDVYDNNYPGQIREVRVDTNENTWGYSGATDPSVSQALYEGDAGTKTLGVEGVKSGLATQPCPFCGGQNRQDEGGDQGGSGEAGDNSGASGLGGNGSGGTEVFWQGNPGNQNHSNVSLVDSDGNRSGCNGDGCENQIPGVTVLPTLDAGDGVPVWEESPPPSFDVPNGQDFKVDLNGDDMNEGDSEGVSVVRNGVSFDVSGLRMEQGDGQQVQIGNRDLTLPNRSDHNVGPELGYGDTTGGSGFEVSADTSGVDPDASIQLTAIPDQRRMKLDFEGASDETAGVQVTVRRTDRNGDVKAAHTREITLGDANPGLVTYTTKAMRDGRLGVRKRHRKHRQHNKKHHQRHHKHH